MGMKKQFNLLADQAHRRLEQLAVESNRPVFGHPSPDPLSKVMGKVVGGRSYTLQVVSEAGQWRLASGTVLALMIDLV